MGLLHLASPRLLGSIPPEAASDGGGWASLIARARSAHGAPYRHGWGDPAHVRLLGLHQPTWRAIVSGSIARGACAARFNLEVLRDVPDRGVCLACCSSL